MVHLASYSPRAYQRHQFNIRTFYGFRAFDLAACRLLLKEIAVLVRFQVKPKVIFWRCVDVLFFREKIEVPSYTRLTKLILGAISQRSQELAAIVEQTLTQDVRALLESLLTQEPLEGTSVPGKASAYKLTLMKKLSQSTKPSKVKERVADLVLVEGLYHQLGPALLTDTSRAVWADCGLASSRASRSSNCADNSTGKNKGVSKRFAARSRLRQPNPM